MAIFFPLSLLVAPTTAPCAANEILLRNRTCHCPFFRYNGLCLRRRFQTTVNSTLEALYANARHLLAAPMLLTVDASNEEAMQALAESLRGSMRSAGTVVTRVVDATDVLVGGDASATLELTNVTVDGGFLGLTVECRFPQADYFYLYMHLGASTPACPPFDSLNQCCRGRMGAEFVTAEGVDCTGPDPFGPLDDFVRMWNGRYLTDDRQSIYLSVDLAQVPSAFEPNARVYRLGVGMVVFGRLAQNTEARAELALNSSAVATSYGAFQYSCVEYSRLQLERCGDRVFAHLVIKARGRVQAVQSLRYQTWDGGEWLTPNCTNGAAVMLGANRLYPCNVSIGDDFIDVYLAMPTPVNRTTALYVLLQQSGPVLTRVVAKTDDTALSHCNAPVTINATGHNAFTIRVLQGAQVKYAGPLQMVQLTDVAALTISIVSESALYAYALDNVSVVYSLVSADRILALMPDGRITPELERLCDSGSVCLVEELLVAGVCQTVEKCEVQDGGLFLMPLYPWGSATLKDGTYTVMVAQIKETLLDNNAGNSKVAKTNSSSLVRRLMSWIF